MVDKFTYSQSQEQQRKKMGKSGIIIRSSGDIPDEVIKEIKRSSGLGLKEVKDSNFVFMPEKGTETSDIISFLSSRGVKVEEAIKQEASLEEMYSNILKEAEPS